MDKKISDWLGSFKTCWNFLLGLLTALQIGLWCIDKESLFETFSTLKIRNFGYTPTCLQFLRKSMPSLSLFCSYFNFPYFRKSSTVTSLYFRAISFYILIIFLEVTKLQFWRKITPFLKRRVSIILWYFSS